MDNSQKVSKHLKSSSQKSRAPKNTARAFLKRVQNTLHTNHLLERKSRILLAVSGGPDSMALLYALSLLQKKYDWHLAVAHMNYGLRGADSTADARLVKEAAHTLGLPLYTLQKKVSVRTSEETLRTLRYTFFESLVTKHQFDYVALAHHQDDQAETVLLRLIRGSGSLGLCAMRSKRGIYVRPFLDFSKQQLLDFLHSENIPYRLDSTNSENVYLRNNVRNVLIPLLETYNPLIKKTLAETAKTLQQEQESQTRTLSTPLLITDHGAKISLSLEWLQAKSPTEQIALIRSLFQQKGLALPTKKLAETLQKDCSLAPKKGFLKEYSRLRLCMNNGMIDIHFKELD